LLISSSFIDFYNIFYPKKADGFVWKFGFFWGIPLDFPSLIIFPLEHYPNWWCQQLAIEVMAIESSWVFPWKIVIFHSYVSLPEGTLLFFPISSLFSEGSPWAVDVRPWDNAWNWSPCAFDSPRQALALLVDELKD
jgi:hypothetical protein